MTADTPRYALLSNGSRFGRRVLRALLHRNRAPALLVLPEFPPAPETGHSLLRHGKKSRFGPLAETIEIAYAPRAGQAKLAERLRRERFAYLLVACWPYLLDTDLCTCAEHYALNLHPSLLPAYRGADPIGAQLANDDRDPGVSLHLLSPRFDHGDIVARAPLPRSQQPTTRDEYEASCAQLGAALFDNLLENPGTLASPLPQDTRKSYILSKIQ